MKKFVILFCCFAMFMLGACSVGIASAEQTWPIKIWKQNENGVFTTLYVVDEDTGVNYIVISGQNYSNTPTVAITPRLNADGSLYVE